MTNVLAHPDLSSEQIAELLEAWAVAVAAAVGVAVAVAVAVLRISFYEFSTTDFRWDAAPSTQPEKGGRHD